MGGEEILPVLYCEVNWLSQPCHLKVNPHSHTHARAFCWSEMIRLPSFSVLLSEASSKTGFLKWPHSSARYFSSLLPKPHQFRLVSLRLCGVTTKKTIVILIWPLRSWWNRVSLVLLVRIFLLVYLCSVPQRGRAAERCCGEKMRPNPKFAQCFWQLRGDSVDAFLQTSWLPSLLTWICTLHNGREELQKCLWCMSLLHAGSSGFHLRTVACLGHNHWDMECLKRWWLLVKWLLSKMTLD